MDLQKIELESSPKKSTTPSSPVTQRASVAQSDEMADGPSLFSPINIALFVIVLLLGLGSGYLLKSQTKTATRNDGPIIARNVPEAGVKEGDIIGMQDVGGFKDSSTGVLQKGGTGGEGSHHLLRPGGASQTVYLTSSVIDLDAFAGHQVTVWGETFKAQKAGWLMDVGRVKVEKLNAPNPQ